MAQYSGGALTGAGSTTLPMFALYAGATGAPILKGVRIWNTTSTAFAVELVRLTTAGTWTSVTEAAFRDRAAANIAQLFHTASGTAPTVGTRLGIFYRLGAADGTGVIDSFNEGIVIPTGVANGIGLIPVGAAGQASYVTFLYEDE
jgi:hypothetical protein